MFDLPDDWVWDFWIADDGPEHHLFHLLAPRSLGDPDLRHRNASVGHAVSTDLRTWVRRGGVLRAAPEPAFDDLAIWTGSVVRGDDARWRMFYTGLSRRDDGRVQRIGAATSDDLSTWRRTSAAPVEADDRWYERRPATDWPEEAWRDPWVVRDDEGTWHMYVTARAGKGSGLGVVGHATSQDLSSWTVHPPLSSPTGRFEWLEVISLVVVDGRWVALFSCLSHEMPGSEPGDGGIWCVPVDGPGRPVDVGSAVRLTGEDLYVGKIHVSGDGTASLLAFQNRGPDGRFAGGVIDPLPVGWRRDGAGLEVTAGKHRDRG